MKAIKLGALIGLLVTMVAGCGLVSGTVFLSEKVSDELFSASSGAMRDGGLPTLDAVGNAVVDLTDNADYGDIDVNGIEAGCISTRAINCHPTLPISGEVWVTLDTTLVTESPAVIRANGFRAFHGLFLAAQDTHVFTCQETFDLIENLDLVTEAVARGYFKVWAIGDQDVYCLKLQNVYVGMHVTGSL